MNERGIAMLLLWNMFEMVGTIAFAISGAVVGIRRNMDVFGIVVLSILTAVGGGMIRDVLAGYTPPAALENPGNLLLSILTAMGLSLYFALFGMRGRKKRIMIYCYALADMIGLASFTVTGTLTGLSQGEPHSFLYPLMLGMLTAVGGGILRDLMAQRVPVVLVADVYATASLAGSLLMCLCWHYISRELAPWICVMCVVALRIMAIKFKWRLLHPRERKWRREVVTEDDRTEEH